MSVPSISAPPTPTPDFRSGARDAGWWFVDAYDGHRYVFSISGRALLDILQDKIARHMARLSSDGRGNAFREDGPWEESSILNNFQPGNVSFGTSPREFVPGRWGYDFTAGLWKYAADKMRGGNTPSAPTITDARQIAALDAIERVYVEGAVSPEAMRVAVWAALGDEMGLPWAQFGRLSFPGGYAIPVAFDTRPADPVDPANRQMRVVGRSGIVPAPYQPPPPPPPPPQPAPPVPAPPAPPAPPSAPPSGLTRSDAGTLALIAAGMIAAGVTVVAIRRYRR